MNPLQPDSLFDVWPVPTGRVVAVVVGLCALMTGCVSTDPDRVLQLRKDNDRLTAELAETTKQLADQCQLVDAQTEHIKTLEKLGAKRLEKLYHPTRLEIEKLSGGYDEDGQPGDDGVAVYLRPIDAEGDVLKVAGAITVELFDLANPDGKHLVGKVSLTVDQARAVWHGRLWTDHYTVKCPFTVAPAHKEITIRASFTDYLTGKTLREQHVCEVNHAVAQSDR